jgi:hypothetical protein
MLSYEQNYNQHYNIVSNQEGLVNLERNTPSTNSSSDTSSVGSSLSSSPSHSNTPNKYIYSTPCVSSSYHNQNNYYQNYYNQYQNQAQHNLPSISTLITNNNSSFDDSNYYSRNNSLNDTNNSSVQKSTPNVVQQLKPTKPLLKFSIESILGIGNCESSKNDEQFEHSSVQLNQINNNTSKKRKSMNSLAKNCDVDHDNSNKRMRTIFTQEQLDALEMEFMRQQYMVGSERSYLASALNLSESQVKIWFQNRRIKWRKSQSGQQNANGSMRGDGNCDQSFDSECE